MSKDAHSGLDFITEVVDINQEEGWPLDRALGYT